MYLNRFFRFDYHEIKNNTMFVIISVSPKHENTKNYYRQIH